MPSYTDDYQGKDAPDLEVQAQKRGAEIFPGKEIWVNPDYQIRPLPGTHKVAANITVSPVEIKLVQQGLAAHKAAEKYMLGHEDKSPGEHEHDWAPGGENLDTWVCNTDGCDAVAG